MLSNPALFDNFEPVEQVAVLVDSAATRVGKSTSTEVLAQMLEHNIPAGLVVAGDELLFTKVLTADELSRYQRVYVPGELVVEGPQRAVVEAGMAAGRVEVYTSMKEVLSQITPLIEVLEGGRDVLVLPRRKVESGRTEIALHLLNRDFSQAADNIRPHERVRLVVHDDLLAGIDQPTFELHAPEPTQQSDLTVHRAANRPGYVVEVPNLEMWAILLISG